VTHRIVS